MKPNNVTWLGNRAGSCRLMLVRTKLAGLLVALILPAIMIGCTNAPNGQSTTSGSSGQFPGTEAAPVIGVVVDENLKVIDIEAESAAQRAGIARGDVLKTLDSIPLVSGGDAMQRFRAKTLVVGQRVNIVLNRGGKEMMITVLPSPPVARSGQATPTPVPANEFYF